MRVAHERAHALERGLSTSPRGLGAAVGGGESMLITYLIILFDDNNNNNNNNNNDHNHDDNSNNNIINNDNIDNSNYNNNNNDNNNIINLISLCIGQALLIDVMISLSYQNFDDNLTLTSLLSFITLLPFLCCHYKSYHLSLPCSPFL